MKLGELVSFLDDNGLALPNLPAITEQSIAGAISTGEQLCECLIPCMQQLNVPAIVVACVIVVT